MTKFAINVKEVHTRKIEIQDAVDYNDAIIQTQEYLETGFDKNGNELPCNLIGEYSHTLESYEWDGYSLTPDGKIDKHFKERG
ncbi:MAG: hypothetical protein V1720_11590 [bacterium]